MTAKDKRTILTVDWSKSRGAASMALDTQGKTLPDEIKVMLVGHLLRDLHGKYALELRPLR